MKKLSSYQRLFKFLSSGKGFENAKAESLLWGFSCSACNERTSFWEMGGIRYKASGNPKTRVICSHCGNKGVEVINKLED